MQTRTTWRNLEGRKKKKTSKKKKKSFRQVGRKMKLMKKVLGGSLSSDSNANGADNTDRSDVYFSNCGEEHERFFAEDDDGDNATGSTGSASSLQSFSSSSHASASSTSLGADSSSSSSSSSMSTGNENQNHYFYFSPNVNGSERERRQARMRRHGFGRLDDDETLLEIKSFSKYSFAGDGSDGLSEYLEGAERREGSYGVWKLCRRQVRCDYDGLSTSQRRMIVYELNSSMTLRAHVDRLCELFRVASVGREDGQQQQQGKDGDGAQNSMALRRVASGADRFGLACAATHEWLAEQHLFGPASVPRQLVLRLLPPYSVPPMLEALVKSADDERQAKAAIFAVQRRLGECRWFAAEFAARGGLRAVCTYTKSTTGKTQEYSLAALANSLLHDVGLDSLGEADVEPPLAVICSPSVLQRLLAAKTSVQILARAADDAKLGAHIGEVFETRKLLPRCVAMLDIEEVGVQCGTLRLLSGLALAASLDSGERRRFVEQLIDAGLLGRVLAMCNTTKEELRMLILQLQRIVLSTKLPVPFDSGDERHEALLARLWELSEPREPLAARRSEQWSQIGFQSDDPARDFRAMGVSGLEHLLYLATEHTDFYLATVRRLRVMLASVDITNSLWYPFAIAGINISQLLYSLLAMPDQRAAYSEHNLSLVSVADALASADTSDDPDEPDELNLIFFSDARAFEKMYVLAFRLFDATWQESNASYMDFSSVIDTVRSGLAHAVRTSTSIRQFSATVSQLIDGDGDNDGVGDGSTAAAAMAAAAAIAAAGDDAGDESGLPCRVHQWSNRAVKMRHFCYLCQAYDRRDQRYCTQCDRYVHAACWDRQKHAVGATARTRPVEHTLKLVSFKKPALCVACNRSIMPSAFRKAMRCSACALPCHRSCGDSLRPDCNTLLYRGKKAAASGGAGAGADEDGDSASASGSSSSASGSSSSAAAASLSPSLSRTRDTSMSDVLGSSPASARGALSAHSVFQHDIASDMSGAASGDKKRKMPAYLQSLVDAMLKDANSTSAASILLTPNVFAINIEQSTLDDAFSLLQRGHGFEWRDTRRPHHTLANLIKLFLRKLPEPPVTLRLAPEFCDAVAPELSHESSITALANLAARLPRANYQFCRAFMSFLAVVASHHEANFMHATKLGGIFGPLIVGRSSPFGVIGHYAGAKCVELMIENKSKVFIKK
jgi:ELMO/CED-12 family/RhoGAP domain/Phorbol esters/diacylglycerol binding domain (C1 domain)